MVDALVHTTVIAATTPPIEVINIRERAQEIKQRMTWPQYITGMINSIYWLSPLGKLHDKDKYNLYWSIKSQL
jgi:hypothetical protein